MSYIKYYWSILKSIIGVYEIYFIYLGYVCA